MRYTGLDGTVRKTFAVFHLVPLCFLKRSSSWLTKLRMWLTKLRMWLAATDVVGGHYQCQETNPSS